MGYIALLKMEAIILSHPVQNYAKLFICQIAYNFKLYKEKCVLFLRLKKKLCIKINTSGEQSSAFTTKPAK